MIKDYSKPAEDVDNFPRISQLSYNLYDEKQTLIKSVNNYVYPDGWAFPDEPFFKENADINKNVKLGLPIKNVLQEYIDDRLASKYCIAHNIGFDTKVIRSEMIRAGLNIEFTAKKVCTMASSTKYCNIPKQSGKGLKWPKLDELHSKLFGVGFEGAHDSQGDVFATAKCFFELLRIKVITLD